MANIGLASGTVVKIVIMVIVLVIAVYLAISYFLPGKTSLFGSACKSYMLTQCSACVAGTGGGDCASSGILTCGCNECTIQYAGLEQARAKECVAELRNSGIAIDDSGIFQTTECNKLGVPYTEHPVGKCG